jgi:hypothetical protein
LRAKRNRRAFLRIKDDCGNPAKMRVTFLWPAKRVDEDEKKPGRAGL